jgi:hypothetical protein
VFVNTGLTTTFDPGTTFYRITSPVFLTTIPEDYPKVVNGQGAVKNGEGSRYRYPNVCTVYLTEDIETCLAERMFYFHQEVIRGLDQLRYRYPIPPFQRECILWEIQFDYLVADVFDLCIPGAPNYFQVFPSLMVNPSQDYDHLKQIRADIQTAGYNGLRAPSSRSKSGRNLIVFFYDQSSHVMKIQPYRATFRLVANDRTPFFNPAVQVMDFTAGEGIIPSLYLVGGDEYRDWRRVEFNH